jgi:ABC-type maltose transport system permease subunit
MENLLWINSKWRSKAILSVVAIVATLWVLGPFLWAINNSFKTLEATFSTGAIIPFLNFQPTLDSWKEVLGNPNSLKSMVNSAMVALGTTILVLRSRQQRYRAMVPFAARVTPRGGFGSLLCPHGALASA